ncbi:hypothetical protein [Chromohalobacter sp. HP20-39]|uniref:hypothetical protein n=1 Tax=Chromohalobacter sp. HP20-39 TaxID=3079306 RepID=UPI00294B0D07|nr:hypothetical protein [Chromohalobacter sp. HP20-39]MDV6319137.1 hypothetical protein [Chromohalobacter sp. HP20-39]
MTAKKAPPLPKSIALIFLTIVLTGCEYGEKLENLQEKTKTLENKVKKLETQYQNIKIKYDQQQKVNSEKVQNMLR